MTLQEAADILEKHNKWRRSEDINTINKMQSPKDIGEAIDVLVKFVKENNP